MSQSKQTVRLEVGHHATFKWKDIRGKLHRGTFIVGENHDDSTTPKTESASWLKNFIGKGVGHVATVSQPEDNVLQMTLVAIKLPVSTG